MEYGANANNIKEANEICKMMGRRVKFKQCIVQQMVDDSGRTMTCVDEMARNMSNASESDMAFQVKEELQIRVHNFEKGNIVMWTESQF